MTVYVVVQSHGLLPLGVYATEAAAHAAVAAIATFHHERIVNGGEPPSSEVIPYYVPDA